MFSSFKPVVVQEKEQAFFENFLLSPLSSKNYSSLARASNMSFKSSLVETIASFSRIKARVIIVAAHILASPASRPGPPSLGGCQIQLYTQACFSSGLSSLVLPTVGFKMIQSSFFATHVLPFKPKSHPWTSVHIHFFNFSRFSHYHS